MRVVFEEYHWARSRMLLSRLLCRLQGVLSSITALKKLCNHPRLVLDGAYVKCRYLSSTTILWIMRVPIVVCRDSWR